MTETIHGTALVFGTTGLLIRGPSASGKSLLARDLLSQAKALSIHGSLISDDRVKLSVKGGRLIGEAMPQTAGLIEIRNRGIAETRFQKSAIIRLIVDFAPPPDLERMPEEAELQTEIMGLTLPRQMLPAGQRVALDIVCEALKQAVARA